MAARQAVIVVGAPTHIGNANRGAFNATYGATLGAHSVAAAVERAGIDPSEVDDVIMGGTWGEGTTGQNIARQIAVRAGLPVTVPGVTVNHFCSTGLEYLDTKYIALKGTGLPADESTSDQVVLTAVGMPCQHARAGGAPQPAAPRSAVEPRRVGWVLLVSARSAPLMAT